MDVEDTQGAGMSRRDALKRGAVVGGALLWTAPVVQGLTMTAATAESPSAPPRGGHPAKPAHPVHPAKPAKPKKP